VVERSDEGPKAAVRGSGGRELTNARARAKTLRME